ncbi:MAG: hypothetical protein ACHQK8_08410 [Bacteroidia bacterium]
MILLSFCSDSFAQPNLYFINRAKHRIIEVKPGQMLSVKYKGYLGQMEFAKESVTDINDSMITLGINPEIFSPGIEKMLTNSPKFIHRKIYIKDIVAFRRITLARSLMKTTLVGANIFGSYYLLFNYYKKNNFTTSETFFISLGVGIASTILINLIFPEKPKHRMENGWEAATGYSKPKL